MRNVTDADFERLIDALIEVESGGDDNAVGDAGQSLGCLQIGRACLADYNRLNGDPGPNGEVVDVYDHEDMFRREFAKTVCRWYLAYWTERAWVTRGVPPSLEMAARIWNGGPHGYARKATQPYWERVSALLNQ